MYKKKQIQAHKIFQPSPEGRMFHVNLKKQSGFALVSVLAAIAIMAIMLPSLFSLIAKTNNQVSEKVIGSQLNRVGSAVKDYVYAHYSDLETSSTPSVATKVPFASLITEGFLPANFQSINTWGQTYNVYILEPKPEHLQAIIVTAGGRAHDVKNPSFATQNVPGAASRAGAEGGYVPAGIIAGEPNTILQGVYGGWKFPFAGTNIPNPGAGHLGSMIYFDNANLATDFLYRRPIPGQPQLNMMTTDLDMQNDGNPLTEVNLNMNGNTIRMGDGDVGGGDTEGIKRLNFEQHDLSAELALFPCDNTDETEGTVFFDKDDGLYVCRKGQMELITDTGNNPASTKLAGAGSIIPKPICSTGKTPRIYLAPSRFSQDAVQLTIRSVQTWASDNGTSWTVHMAILTRQGWMTPNSTYSSMVVISECQ